MSSSKTKRDREKQPAFHELDDVKVTKPLVVNDHLLAAGMAGTIVYCHGVAAYEVEFPGINDIFQIPADHLAKI